MPVCISSSSETRMTGEYTKRRGEGVVTKSKKLKVRMEIDNDKL